MNIQLLNRLLRKSTLTLVGLILLIPTHLTVAQGDINDASQYQGEQNTLSKMDIDRIRWKTESQVRELLGEPTSVHGPVGTHASYTLWKYPDYTVAFANQRAFHMFDKNSLHKIELNESRE